MIAQTPKGARLLDAIVLGVASTGKAPVILDERRLRPRPRLTRRPWPDGDPSIDALSDEDRRVIAAVWAGRVGSELRMIDVFTYIAGALVELDAAPAVIALARRAVDDERRHVEICHRVASAYAGRELALPERAPLRVPRHDGAGPALLRLLHVIGQCCLNETTAAVFGRRCLGMATTPLARAALREIVGDEVDHARIGWAQLACTRAAQRAAVAPWLPAMVDRHLRSWRSPAPFASNAALERHGWPSSAVSDAEVERALDEVILPGLSSLGVDVAPASVRGGDQ